MKEELDVEALSSRRSRHFRIDFYHHKDFSLFVP